VNGHPTTLGVLLIDDNAVWAKEVVRLIESSLPFSNRRVRWEGSMAAALAALNEFQADRVWLDLDLSDSRPLETLQRIRDFPEPVYVLSDHFDKTNPLASKLAMECMEAGAHRVYPKDFETISFLVRDMAQAHIHKTLHVQSS
jgi:CheY-like chemotaxis protein